MVVLRLVCSQYDGAAEWIDAVSKSSALSMESVGRADCKGASTRAAAMVVVVLVVIVVVVVVVTVSVDGVCSAKFRDGERIERFRSV